jgi:hypothetical protein
MPQLNVSDGPPNLSYRSPTKEEVLSCIALDLPCYTSWERLRFNTTRVTGGNLGCLAAAVRLPQISEVSLTWLRELQATFVLGVSERQPRPLAACAGSAPPPTRAGLGRPW